MPPVKTTHRMITRYHPAIGHLFVPNLRARVMSERGGYYVRTNSAGFRSDVEFEAARSGRPRILFFGDSITAADGVSNGERFAELVGERLGAEVYNYGVSGTGTDQQYLIWRELAREVQADLIVLGVFVENIERIKVRYRESLDRLSGERVLVPKPYFTLGDGGLELHHSPVPRARPDKAIVEPEHVHWDVAPGQQRFHRLLSFYRHDPRMDGVRRSIRKFSPRLRSQLVRLGRYQPLSDYKDPDSDACRLLRAILERWIDELGTAVPIVLMPIPTYNHYGDGAAPIFRPTFEEIARLRPDVTLVDLHEPLRSLPFDERRKLVFNDDRTHFSPAGHERVARVLTAAIRDHGLLPAAATAGSAEPAADPVPAVAGGAGASRTVLGISAFYHDSAAALVRDGEIVAACQEERFSRVKNDRRFPLQAANFCLEQAGIQQGDLDAVVYYDNAALTFERLMHTLAATAPDSEDAWQRILPSWVRFKLHLPALIRRELKYDGPILQEVHHRSHAASAFYPSPFERAAILTIDGVGEWATASIGQGEGSTVRLLREMKFPNSIGLLYSAFTQFTGFKVNSGEYKMMGLAPYGEPKYVDAILSHLVDLAGDGSITLKLPYFDFLTRPSMTGERFAELFDGPARPPDSRITRREMHIAKSIQVVTEEAMLRMARHARELTGETRLCMAGGVVLNCVANGRILREGPFEEIWMQPAAGDAGCALGAALDAWHTYYGGKRSRREDGRSTQGGSYLGPAYGPDEIGSFLDTWGYPNERLDPAERADTIAALLEQGKVVGHFCGRTEFGPRALGARSILGDPRNAETQVNLNLKIKYRESFRPFAPSVLAERVGDYFELDRESPYMLLVAPVKEERQIPFELGDREDMLEVVREPRSDVPAITHVDYSARVQSVSRHDNPEYWELIRAFERRTGCGVIVNTSFNVRGEPIVNTPYDAYRCFMRTEMDALVLGDFILYKPDQPDWPEPKGHIEEHDTTPAALPDDPLNARLRKLYSGTFAGIGERLQTSRALLIPPGGNVASTWEEYRGADSPKQVFEVPHELDAGGDGVDGDAWAEALTRSWVGRDAVAELQPVLRELLRLGKRFPGRSALEEEVSDTIYVMF
jgi:carbamoyltransferase